MRDHFFGRMLAGRIDPVGNDDERPPALTVAGEVPGTLIERVVERRRAEGRQVVEAPPNRFAVAGEGDHAPVAMVESGESDLVGRVESQKDLVHGFPYPRVAHLAFHASARIDDEQQSRLRAARLTEVHQLLALAAFEYEQLFRP